MRYTDIIPYGYPIYLLGGCSYKNSYIATKVTTPYCLKQPPIFCSEIERYYRPQPLPVEERVYAHIATWGRLKIKFLYTLNYKLYSKLCEPLMKGYMAIDNCLSREEKLRVIMRHTHPRILAKLICVTRFKTQKSN